MAEELLFDELLSPSEEEGRTFVPNVTSQLENLDIQQNTGPGGDQVRLATAKSMENILLENCGMEESIDLGNSSSIVEEPSEADIIDPLSDDNYTVDHAAGHESDVQRESHGENNVVKTDIFDEMKDDNEKHDAQPQEQTTQTGDITKYFNQSQSSGDIFDDLAASSCNFGSDGVTPGQTVNNKHLLL